MNRTNGYEKGSILVMYCPSTILDLNSKNEEKIKLRKYLIDCGIKFKNKNLEGMTHPDFIKVELLTSKMNVVVNGPPKIMDRNTNNKNYIEIQEYCDKVLSEIKDMYEDEFYSIICPDFLRFRNVN